MRNFSNLTSDDLKLGKEQLKELLNQRLKSYEGKSNYEYSKRQFSNYIENAGKQDENLIETNKLVREIYKLNQPVLHSYYLTKIN